MLALDDVHAYYGNIHALKGLTLQVEKGEIVTLVGANGAGKSTTIRTITGLLHSMGLAPTMVEVIFQTIQEINRQGTTILLVEQNALMALEVAHRGYVLQSGRSVLHDTGANLLQNAMVRKVYLGID
jgi:ABC-type branched-subunit amino acid transport system ATPase component